MLAAVHVTEEQLIAPWYVIQISVPLAFSYTKHVMVHCKTLVTIYCMHFTVNLICIKSFCPQNKHNSKVVVTGQFQWQHHLI